ncbi:hypothetical protein ACFL0J_04245 [Candidatus Neomarinimicrobiota bacterium]
MKTNAIKLVLLLIGTVYVLTTYTIAAPVKNKVNLSKTFNLAGERSTEIQYFKMESNVTTYDLDGTRNKYTTLRLYLKVVPSKSSGGPGDEYTCLRFSIQENDAPKIEIPALKDWVHNFGDIGIDDKGQVFGIDHHKFENLTDDNGNVLDTDQRYSIYNAFIDFHGFCDLFAQPSPSGNGIQHLSNIGDTIVHAAAFTEAPVNLGNEIREGSIFKNGEITLNFKGISTIDDNLCALIEYDSGESSFKMLMQPAPNFEIKTIGSSHYFGDIYKNLKSNWIQKVILKEFVVSETIIPAPASNIINAVIEREIIINNIKETDLSESIN